MGRIIRKIIDWCKKSHPNILSIALLLLALLLITFIVFLSFGYSFAVRDSVWLDWDAIGTVLSFIAAGSAIWVAVFIPWQISEKQNRISIFDEKFETYQKCVKFLTHWRTYTKLFVDSKDKDKRLQILLSSIQELFHKGDNAEELIRRYLKEDVIPADLLAFISDIHNDNTVLFDKASFLFVCLDNSDVKDISDAFSDFFRALTISLYNKKLQIGIIKYCEDFQEEIVKFINKGYLTKMNREIGKIEV